MVSQHAQPLRSSGQVAATSPSHHHHVLDPHTEFPRQVDSWFNRDDVTDLQLRRVFRADPRQLVNLPADPVAQGMHEVLAVTSLLDDIPGDRIELSATDIWFDLPNRRFL